MVQSIDMFLKISFGLLRLEITITAKRPMEDLRISPKPVFIIFPLVYVIYLMNEALFYAFRLNYDSCGGSILMNLNSLVCDLMSLIMGASGKIRPRLFINITGLSGIRIDFFFSPFTSFLF